jgi:hypothetical protein
MKGGGGGGYERRWQPAAAQDFRFQILDCRFWIAGHLHRLEFVEFKSEIFNLKSKDQFSESL